MKDSEVMTDVKAGSVRWCRKCGASVPDHLSEKHVGWHRALERLLNIRPYEDDEEWGG